jgi:hypothetical protein
MEKPCACHLAMRCAWPAQGPDPWHANMAEMTSLIAIDRVRSLKVRGDFDKTMGVKGAELWFAAV